MLRLAVLLTNDRGAAEDAVQDAFVAIQRNKQAPSNVEEAAAYLRVTVVNRCRSQLRHRYVVSRFRQQSIRTEGVSEPALDLDETDATIRALSRLPRRQREVLVLRYWADLTHNQIAEVLGIAPGSVKAASSRGLATLRSFVEES